MSEQQRKPLGWILLGAIAIAVGLVIGGTAGILLTSAGAWTAIIAGVYLAVKLIR